MTNRSTFAKAAIALTLAIGGIAITAPATAGTDEALSTEISVSGIDLGSPEGVSTLNRRVQMAARKVCPSSDGDDLSAQVKQRQCYKRAVATAQLQIEAMRSRKTQGETSVLASADITSPITK